MATRHLKTAEFDKEVLGCEGAALVDFWASWCGPCRMLGPIIDEIAKESEGVVVAKVNVDEEPELAARYGVMTIPTVIVFKNGEEAERIVGVQPKQKFLSALEQASR